MEIAIAGVVATILAAVIGYWAARWATAQQIGALKEEIALVLRQLDVSAVGMTSNELTAIDELMIQYPRYRACFFDGVEPGKTADIKWEDKERVKAIASRLVNGYATILLQSRRIPESRQFDIAWVNATIARRYGSSPACCDHLLSYIEEYAVTGEHQFKLMLKGLGDALILAQQQNEQEKVEQLTLRIATAQSRQEDIFRKLSVIREESSTI
jgi:hypothetical protein